MKTKQDTTLTGIWAIFWRSFVYMPLGLAVFLLLVGVIVALIFPPIIGAMCLCYGLWWQGIAAFAVWSLVIVAWRYFRLARFFEL